MALSNTQKRKIEERNQQWREQRAAFNRLYPDSKIVKEVACPCGRMFRPLRDIACIGAATRLADRSRYCSQTCFERLGAQKGK